MNDYIVCNFSGGKDSTAMVLRMIELGVLLKQVGMLLKVLLGRPLSIEEKDAEKQVSFFE